MDFQTAVKTCFTKYAVFKGRASRSEFWWFVLFATILGILIHALSIGLWLLSCIVLLLPNLSVSVRRLHDRGITGWWLLLQYAIFCVPWILLFFNFVLKGTDGSIHYGDDPLLSPLLLTSGVGALGGIPILIIFTLKGTDGPNRYGDDPLVAASQDTGHVNYPARKTREQNRTRTDILGLLERLHDLRQKGILTDAEFEQQKKRILGG
jgi:uncharacterized membrane protein YhaH (DUF805 family)